MPPNLSLLAGWTVLLWVACIAAGEEPRRPACGLLVTKIYAVADLLVPISGYHEPDPAKVNPEMQRIMDVVEPVAHPTRPLHKRLFSLIVNTIAPTSWAARGGRGDIEYFPLGMALVITQTADVHEQVAELLETLRQLHDLQLSFELRMIRLSAAMAERLKKDFGIDCGVGNQADDALKAPRVTRLDDLGVFQMLEALQEQGPITVMEVPKITLRNGELRTIQNEPGSLGWSIGMQGIVSTDRRSMRVNLEVRMTEFTPATAKHSIHMDDGHTMLSGWKIRRESGEAGETSEDAYLLLLATPRILVKDEEEIISTGVSTKDYRVDPCRLAGLAQRLEQHYPFHAFLKNPTQFLNMIPSMSSAV